MRNDNKQRMVHHTNVKDRSSKFDMTKMAWTFRHPLTARLTLEVAIYGTHPRVHKPTNLRFMRALLP